MLEELRDAGEARSTTRRRLAGVGRSRRPRRTTRRSRAGFASGDALPETLALAFDRVLELAYGENPHQRAAYYAQRGSAHAPARRASSSCSGKPLSFNNLNDLSAARLLAARARRARLRHRQAREPLRCRPSAGRSRRPTERALAADPVSAYGGVVVLNRPVSGRARRDARRAVRRGPVRARLRRAGARSARAEACDAHPERHRAPGVDGSRARLPAGPRRAPRPGARLGTSRTARRRWRSSAASSTRRVGRSALRLDGGASTSPRTRSCSRAAGRRSGSVRGR